MEFLYSMPTKLYFGKNIIKTHAEKLSKYGSKALIVTGRSSSKKNGSLDDVINALNFKGIEYIIFDKVEENPSLETIEIAGLLGREEKVDFIIGIGGGSPLDAAKAIGVFINNTDINIDNIFTEKTLKSLPIIAVPTTSGTGSEVTPYSILTVNKEKTKRNLGQAIFPDLAFIDINYTKNLPYDITVNTAIDAFTHLIEGFLNSNSNVLSDIYGEKGFCLFRECFPKLLSRELDEDFREKIMLASVLGGIQIAQNGTSLPHGMGYSLTYFKKLPHGLANGVLTVEYLKCFKNKEKINRILNILQIETLDKLQEIFNQLFDVDIKITEDEINEYAKTFVANKAKLRNHPETVDFEDIVKIYKNSLLANSFGFL